MSNTTSDPRIATLNLILHDCVYYGYPFIFILGNIGSILNILVLTRRVYLRNPCSCYILASTVSNLFNINILILLRFLLIGFGIDPTKTSTFFCSFRYYLSIITTLLSRFYIVLACIDRWAMSSTSVRRRSFSQLKVAKILIPSVMIVWCIASIHVYLNFLIIKGQCTSSSNYTTFYNIFNTILSGLLIPILMFIFGLLTIRNIKRSRQRINAQTVIHQNVRNNTKLRENAMSAMILAQLAFYLISCLPFPMFLMYSTVTMYWTKSALQIALDSIFSLIAFTLLYINFSATFYLYVLTTPIFRKDLKKILLQNKLCRLCFHIE